MTGVQTCALPIYDTATTEIYTLSLHHALPISLTFYSGIKKIPRSNYLIYQFAKQKISTHKYWEPEIAINPGIKPVYAEQKFSELDR